MKYILFTTETCPKCPAFKEAVKDLDVRVISNNDDEFSIGVDLYGITSAPTLVKLEDEKEIGRITDQSQLKEFIQ